MIPNSVDGQWLDFYALLDVPAGAEEDVIRKRIGKVYSEAAANSDHRDITRRLYFQTLVERVLPQCRRVLLDPEWRAKYDRQHILNAHGDPTAQNYVAFIASMRGKDASVPVDEAIPQRLQDEINGARAVVECAWQGTQLELLPTEAVSKRDVPGENVASAASPASTEKVAPKAQNLAPKIPENASARLSAPQSAPKTADSNGRGNAAPKASQPVTAAALPKTGLPVETVAREFEDSAKMASATPQTPVTSSSVASSPVGSKVAPAPVQAAPPAVFVEEINQAGEAAHAQVITAQEASQIRRRRASNPGENAPVSDRLRKTRQGPISRVVVDQAAPTSARGRFLSSTSMNLMVAIVGVLLTITVQKFAGTPAVATSSGRTPIFVAVSPEMEGVLQSAKTGWEKTPEGAGFDLVVQNVVSHEGLRRALGEKAAIPDVWIPSDASWVDLYNRQAASLKRGAITADSSIAQSPMVLIARSERAGELRRAFPNHQIASWSALRFSVARGAAGHLGLADPQKTEAGALSRFSMAREWGASRGLSPALAIKRADFWKWMAVFEDNSPSGSARTGDMIKDMAQGTTGRFWWVIAYESDALRWMNAGKQLEIYYLPRTTYANHPVCTLERVGASDGVARGRTSFEKYLRSDAVQKQALGEGFRPTEISLKTKIGNNPFLRSDFRARGARIEGLPLEERSNAPATRALVQEWGKRFG